MLQLEPIATAPVLDLTPQDVDAIIDELRAYHTIYSPLFQRREQRVRRPAPGGDRPRRAARPAR
jgi:hypothetical protein